MTDALDYIVPELRDYAQPVDAFSAHPDNAREHDLEAIAASLSVHGQRSPVIVQRSTGFIVKGNGTQAAAKMLGWKMLAFLVQDIEDKAALLYLYNDNRASDRATYQRKRYKALLKKLTSGPDPAMTGMFDDSFVMDDIRTELADMVDADEGAEEVETDVNAEFAPNTFGAKAEKATPRLPGEKMREVPLVLSIADYSVFMEQIKALQKRYGTGGAIATIIEAVKRQFAAEDGAAPFVGKAPVAPPVAEGQVGLDEIDPIADAFKHSDELLDAALGKKA